MDTREAQKRIDHFYTILFISIILLGGVSMFAMPWLIALLNPTNPIISGLIGIFSGFAVVMVSYSIAIFAAHLK